jgi:hypothetical protein
MNVNYINQLHTPSTSLEDVIKNTVLLRPNAVPIADNIGLVCFESAFPNISDFLLEHTQEINRVRLRGVKYVQNLQDLCYKKSYTNPCSSRRF